MSQGSEITKKAAMAYARHKLFYMDIPRDYLHRQSLRAPTSDLDVGRGQKVRSKVLSSTFSQAELENGKKN